MKNSKIILIILSALFSFHSFAADLVGISHIFKKTFWTSHYQERFCGRNIEGLVQKAIDARLDLSNAQILQITDPHGSMFGMVQAVVARESGRLIEPARTLPKRNPGVMNWYFHVVLMVEGKILDYDFTNQPRILSLNQYMNEMFIPADKMTNKKWKIDKMKSYRLKSFPAEDYMLRLSQRMTVQEIATETLLKDVIPGFFN